MPSQPHVPYSTVLTRWCLRAVVWSLQALVTLIMLPCQLINQPGIRFLACIVGIVVAILALTPTAFSYLFKLFAAQIFRLSSSSTSALTGLGPITYFCCDVLAVPYFCSSPRQKTPAVPMSQITYSVATSAKLASNIFESVADVGDPRNLALHQGDILELAIAIQHSSDLEAREGLAGQLWELSRLTRDVKDQVIGLNSQGINIFSFVAQEFTRIQTIVERVHAGDSKYTTDTISDNLDRLFDYMSRELSRLLARIELSIPLAARASDLGVNVAGQLFEERFKLIKKKRSTPLWKRLVETGSWGARQLAHDLALTSESVDGLKGTWSRLEDLRAMLVAYRNNVEFFKASLVGYHIADHQVSAEDEIRAMKGFIEKFSQAIEASKLNAMGASSLHVLE